MPPQKSSPSVDIFTMLKETVQKPADKPDQETFRKELLEHTKCKDLYPEGTITINRHTCEGIQCKLCIKACPSNALYWTNSGIGVTEDLCLHCQACVLCCMVEDCIRVTRKREDGKTEAFSKPKDVKTLNDRISSEKRFQRIKDLYESPEDYSRKHGTSK
jgi:Na+-translocating ferredoxin:NAD+ oxidoreductase RNF subunit RnfB